MKIFDAHNHVGHRKGRPSQTMELIIANMDKAGVDKSIIFSYVQVPDNDYIALACKTYPERLVGYAVLNHEKPEEEVVEEFNRCIFELKLRGLKLDTPARGFSLTDFKLLDPVLSICNQYHLPVISYAADDNPFTHPIKFAELAKRYPNVNFIMAHCGILFGTGHCTEIAKEFNNVYIEISNANDLAVKDAIVKAGAHKVLFGTDTPFSYFETTKLKVDMCVSNEEEKRLVYGENMERILSEIRL